MVQLACCNVLRLHLYTHNNMLYMVRIDKKVEKIQLSLLLDKIAKCFNLYFIHSIPSLSCVWVEEGVEAEGAGEGCRFVSVILIVIH